MVRVHPAVPDEIRKHRIISRGDCPIRWATVLRNDPGTTGASSLCPAQISEIVDLGLAQTPRSTTLPRLNDPEGSTTHAAKRRSVASGISGVWTRSGAASLSWESAPPSMYTLRGGGSPTTAASRSSTFEGAALKNSIGACAIE